MELAAQHAKGCSSDGWILIQALGESSDNSETRKRFVCSYNWYGVFSKKKKKKVSENGIVFSMREKYPSLGKIISKYPNNTNETLHRVISAIVPSKLRNKKASRTSLFLLKLSVFLD